MNNEISNHHSGCGCGDCKPACTTCGRPMLVCKGDCGCKSKCCNKTINLCEYGPKHAGCIRERQPECPYTAVIPSVTVEDISNIKDLADCFVHVSKINTTFYIDDKHRITTVWQGSVEIKDYDVEENPLNLRGQIMFDYDNSRIVYFDKQGRPNYIADSEYYKSIIGPTIERMVAEGELNLNIYGEYDEANSNLTLKVGAN